MYVQRVCWFIIRGNTACKTSLYTFQRCSDLQLSVQFVYIFLPLCVCVQVHLYVVVLLKTTSKGVHLTSFVRKHH